MEFRREDRDRAIAWARSVVSDSRVIYLDTETTGLDRTAEIIDIALVTNEGAVLFNTLVKPVRPIPAESSRIHGIFDDHVATAPGWEEVGSTPCSTVVALSYTTRTMTRELSTRCATEPGAGALRATGSARCFTTPHMPVNPDDTADTSGIVSKMWRPPSELFRAATELLKMQLRVGTSSRRWPRPRSRPSLRLCQPNP